jgi:hypothetical protein
MTLAQTRGSVTTLVVCLLTFLLTSCAVTEGGYGYAYPPNVRIGLDYYDPWYGPYGNWGPRYRVGPPQQIMHRSDFDKGRPAPNGVVRPAPGSRPIPSIPSSPRNHGSRIRR